MKSLQSKVVTFATLCVANASMAVAGTEVPIPVAVSAPSVISIAAVAVVAGFIAYKRRK